jgi:uncharacterized membrane protein
LSSLLQYLAGLPPAIIVLIVSATPLIELRGAIPVGLLLGMRPAEAIAWSTAGNLAIIAPVYLGLWAARRWAARWPLVRPFLAWIDGRVARKRAQVDRYGPWGLLLFVGIPLPWTGAIMGAAIAVVLRLPRLKALAAIVGGVLLAAALVGGLSSLGWYILQ